MYPFLKKIKGRLLVKLNSDLYPRELIEKVKTEESDSVIFAAGEKGYYFLELKADDAQDYLNFLNYLLYLKRK